MRRTCFVFIALLIATPVLAHELFGCDNLKWPLDLASAKAVESGGEVPQPLSAAVALTLAPFADTKLPMPPSRMPRSLESYAGFVRVGALANPGTYRITLSQGAWIDVNQDGHEVKSGEFGGATGCDRLRKSVKFDLASAPFIIVLTGVAHSGHTNRAGVIAISNRF